jgi:hypothetical protein
VRLPLRDYSLCKVACSIRVSFIKKWMASDLNTTHASWRDLWRAMEYYEGTARMSPATTRSFSRQREKRRIGRQQDEDRAQRHYSRHRRSPEQGANMTVNSRATKGGSLRTLFRRRLRSFVTTNIGRSSPWPSRPLQKGRGALEVSPLNLIVWQLGSPRGRVIAPLGSPLKAKVMRQLRRPNN